DSRELCLELQRPDIQPYRQKCGLLQRPRELPVAQRQRQLRGSFRRRLHELPSRLQQPLNLCFAQRPAIEAHFIQFPLERLGTWKAAKMEIHSRVIQVRWTNLSLPHKVAVEVEPRFIL